MKMAMQWRWLIVALTFALLIVQPCYAQNPGVEPVGDFGTINWLEQRITAKGIGVPPEKYYGKPQARPLALRAAVTEARRNLFEVVKGVHIDSTTRVKNYMLIDDSIVARVKGILKNSNVDSYQVMPNGSVEATVSLPLTGKMGTILARIAMQPETRPKSTLATRDLERRIRLLENRVIALEDQLKRLDQLALKEQQNKQELRISALSDRFDEMAKKPPASDPPEKTAFPKTIVAKPQPPVMYSGLIIDARQTDFQPCLKPEIYGQGKLIYPGEYVKMEQAVLQGFVRYYRKIGQAQHSTRVGSLPYIIKSLGTPKGNRSLEIGEKEFETLKSLIAMPDSFMSNCHVVI
ncbi:MAG: hypothetical protein JSW04_03525, partial [Desulfobacterales bacterium]